MCSIDLTTVQIKKGKRRFAHLFLLFLTQMFCKETHIILGAC